MAHGGKRKGAGRKPKADELRIIEELDKHVDSKTAFAKLNKLIDEGSFNALKLYFEYRYGKPKETVNTTHNFTKPPKKVFKDFAGND